MTRIICCFFQLSHCGCLTVSPQGLAVQFLGSRQRPAPWPTTCRPHGSCAAPWSSRPSPPSWGSSCSAVSTPTYRGPSWWVHNISHWYYYNQPVARWWSEARLFQIHLKYSRGCLKKQESQCLWMKDSTLPCVNCATHTDTHLGLRTER